MTETSSTPEDPPGIGRLRPGLTSKAHGFFRSSSTSASASILPISSGTIDTTTPTVGINGIDAVTPGAAAAEKEDGAHGTLGAYGIASADSSVPTSPDHHHGVLVGVSHTSSTSSDEILKEKASVLAAGGATRLGPAPLAASPQAPGPRPLIGGPDAAGANVTAPAAGDGNGNDGDHSNPLPKTTDEKAKEFLRDLYRTFKIVIFHSWINWLLVFVPVGIIVKLVPGVHPGVIFAMNCIAIVPLAGLLSHATEAVARKMGDAVGALLNVTFGNAVELIIFIIALVKGEIRIVQASLLGSILANLLLILGMCFFLGGLRYREQIYNSTVTQMSACLLSLSVISLVLPTAFHASFSSQELADAQSLKISRGTSVILLLVYGIYLLFQLKSHAYMYQSTPQHIVDAESQPGPAANWLDSSDSDSSSSSSSSDSDGSGHSRDTMRKRMRKVLRAGRKRKSSVASVDSDLVPTHVSTRTPSIATMHVDENISEGSSSRQHIPRIGSISLENNEEAVEDPPRRSRKGSKRHRRHHRHHRRRKHRRDSEYDSDDHEPTIAERPEPMTELGEGEPRRVDFAIQDSDTLERAQSASRRPLSALRGVSVRHLVTPAVFAQDPAAAAVPAVPAGPVPRVRYGIRRTNSLPDRLGQHTLRAPGAMFPSQIPLATLSSAGVVCEADRGHIDDEDHISNVAAVILLLISTGLVAVCAEFLVDSINDVVHTSPVGEIFIGLIILPIVGNAAEHVTAITVAMKNKMDLAIGVAVGSSIQIALFITPFVVILGWIIDRDMTLYFTLFETVCLFVSTFIVNFLVLDGRSNYLEGALLCSTYIIISVVAFFYPDPKDASSWGI